MLLLKSLVLKFIAKILSIVFIRLWLAGPVRHWFHRLTKTEIMKRVKEKVGVWVCQSRNY